MVWGAVIGTGVSLYAGYRQSKAAKKQGRQAKALSKEAAELRQLEGGIERSDFRYERARLSSTIQARAAASGVQISGSVLAALAENAEEGATEEVRSRVREKEDVDRIRQGGAFQMAQARDRARAAQLSAFASAAGSVATAID